MIIDTVYCISCLYSTETILSDLTGFPSKLTKLQRVLFVLEFVRNCISIKCLSVYLSSVLYKPNATEQIFLQFLT